jgi:hypothetical protein
VASPQKIQEALQSYQQDGWELVSAVSVIGASDAISETVAYMLFFKRPVAQEQPA